MGTKGGVNVTSQCYSVLGWPVGRGDCVSGHGELALWLTVVLKGPVVVGGIDDGVGDSGEKFNLTARHQNSSEGEKRLV